MRRSNAILLLLVPFLASCTTTMHVRKAAAGSTVRGLRYSLPKPLLQVTPAKDGTLAFQWVFVPDSSATYAIETKSYVAKHKAVVEVDEAGLLKKVEWNPQSTEFAKSLLEGSRDVLKAEMERRATEEKAAADAVQKQKDAVATAQKAVDTAQAELDAINAELDILLAHDGGAAAILSARIKKANAELKLANARRALETLQAEGSGGGSGSGAGLSASKKTDFEKAWGPLFFVIEEDPARKTVRLVPVHSQQQFDTFTAPKAAAAQPPPTLLRAAGTGVASAAKNRPMEVVIDVIGPIHSIEKVRLINAAGEDVSSLLIHSNLDKNGKIFLTLSAQAKPGTYRAEITYNRIAEDTRPPMDTVFFGVL